MPEVRVIQPTIQQAKKLRVCAYARVSSDLGDQLHSFATQVDYYTKHIQANDQWEFVDIYADEAVTGTRADQRTEFQRLLYDCRAGKIDRVLVKSISRFARNLTDCIAAVRELKQLGIAVEFEKECIDTGTMGSEMLLSMLSSAAQEESKSISENTRWSYRKRMEAGTFIATSAPFGYVFERNQLVPNPEEAPTVQYIFNSYLNGGSFVSIARDLNRQGIRAGVKDTVWKQGHVRGILYNEKYIGDALVQKFYTTETLPRQKKINHGEMKQYYIHGSHPAIIDREVFERVQALLRKKAALHSPKKETEANALSRTIKCAVCGATFRQKRNQHLTKETMWVCMTHAKAIEECPVMPISQGEIHQAFLILYHKLRNNQRPILGTMLSQLQALHDREVYQQPEAAKLHQEIADLMKQNHALSRLQTKGLLDSALFVEQTTEIDGQIHRLRARLKQYQTPNRTRDTLEKTKALLTLLEDSKPLQQFDGDIYKAMVQQVTVDNERITFHLINGLRLAEGRCDT